VTVTERPWELANALLDAIVSAYETEAVELPGRRYVTVGPVAHDCEQLTVALLRVVGASELGGPAQEQVEVQRCLHWRVAQFSISVVRCWPTGDIGRDGQPLAPAVADIEAATRKVAKDVQLVTSAVLDALVADDLGVGPTLAFEQWEPLGPNGGLVGGALTLRVSLV
jgi:hypothetical protein